MNVSKTAHEDDSPRDGVASSARGAETTETENADSASSHSAEKAAADSPTSQIEAVTAERDANYDRWVRAQAELENYRKRVQKEAEQNRLYQALPLIRDLLPGLDNLQRALAAAERSKNMDEVIQGVQMVANQLQDVFAARSVLPIEAVGKPFDPNIHEAVQHIPSADQPAMTVLEEVERGYMIHDRVVRPSKVVVSSGPPAEASGSPAETD